MKICILGKAPTSKDLAPFDDDSIEFWTLSQDNPKRTDLIFEIHDKELNEEAKYIYDISAQHSAPVILIDEQPFKNKVIKYPLKEIQNMLESYGACPQYLMSSIGYMLALAIYRKVEEIHLYGVDMIGDGEYAYQRPNCEWLIGIAQGLGIKVIIPKESVLLKSKIRYGHKDHQLNEHLSPLYKAIKARADEYNKRLDEVIAEFHRNIGARTVLKMIQEGTSIDDALEYMNKSIKEQGLNKVRLEALLEEAMNIAVLAKNM